MTTEQPRVFDARDYECGACPARKGEWCDDTWPMEGTFAPTVGFTHPQRTEYNIARTEGHAVSSDALHDALVRDNHF